MFVFAAVFVVAEAFVVVEAPVVARSAFYDEAIQASTFIKKQYLTKVEAWIASS